MTATNRMSEQVDFLSLVERKARHYELWLTRLTAREQEKLREAIARGYFSWSGGERGRRVKRAYEYWCHTHGRLFISVTYYGRHCATIMCQADPVSSLLVDHRRRPLPAHLIELLPLDPEHYLGMVLGIFPDRQIARGDVQVTPPAQKATMHLEVEVLVLGIERVDLADRPNLVSPIVIDADARMNH